MKIEGKKIEKIVRSQLKGSKLIWELYKQMHLFIQLIMLFVVLLASITISLASKDIKLFLGFFIAGAIIVIFQNTFLLRDIYDSSKMFPFMTMQEIENDYEDKKYLLTISSEIRGFKIKPNGNVEVFTPSGFTFLIPQGIASNKDIGKRIVISSTFFEIEVVDLYSLGIHLTTDVTVE